MSSHLSEEALEKVIHGHKLVENIVNRHETVYGITTGRGAFSNKLVGKEDVKKLQLNILMSNAAGVGEPLDEKVVRAMMLIRLNTLAKGHSGVRPEVLYLLQGMINNRVHPIVYNKGSVGSSGDLAPLGHMGLVLVGRGEAEHEGEILPGNLALKKAGLNRIELEAKEGLAITNGAALTAALAAITALKTKFLLSMADAVSAITIEALGGRIEAFDSRIHKARPYPGQLVTSQNIRRYLLGSQLINVHSTQDAYSVRCIPQVHGAIRGVLNHVYDVIEIELNSATDNPLVFNESTNPCVLSGGNFHGEPLAFAMDYLGIALAELASISERRIARLIDNKANNELLPPGLIDQPGINTGFQLAQYTAAALVSENKVLAHPASVDTIPTALGVEDHNSMGTIAARQAAEIFNNTSIVIGIELFAACQAVDFRIREDSDGVEKMAEGTRRLYKIVREKIPFLEHDIELYPYINEAHKIICDMDLDF